MNDGRVGARRGFTIIEVMLFLAVSGFLLIGIIAGTGTGIARQRYTDSVQDLAQLLREQYSEAINMQMAERGANDDVCYSPSPSDLIPDGGNSISVAQLTSRLNSDGEWEVDAGRGRTSCLIYGIMVMFGRENGQVIQTMPLIGKDVWDSSSGISKGTLESADDLELLRQAGVNNMSVFYERTGGDPNNINNWQCWVRTTGGAPRRLQWQAQAERTDHGVLEATVLIVRSPRDGAVRTYMMNRAIIDVDGVAETDGTSGRVVNYGAINARNGGNGFGLIDDSGSCGGVVSEAVGGYKVLKDVGVNKYLVLDNDGNPDNGFTRAQGFNLDVCVGSQDVFAVAGRRRMIRLLGDGHNASAVELLDADGGDNLCDL